MDVSTNDVLLLLTPLILYCFSTMWERRLHGTSNTFALASTSSNSGDGISTFPTSAIERTKTAFDAAKNTTDQIGVLAALVAAVGFDGMFAERDHSDDVTLAYSLVLLLGTTTAVICTTISTFCSSACSFFLEENMEMAFRVVSPFLGLPVALFMLQLFCLFYALLQDSRLSSLLVFKLSIGCAAVFLTCFSAYIRHYALAACVRAVGQEAIHPTASPSTSSGPRTQARTRSRSKRRSGQSEAHNV